MNQTPSEPDSLTAFRPYCDRQRVGLLTIPDEIVATEEIRTLLRPAPSIYQHRVAFEEVDTPGNRELAMEAMTQGVKTLGQTRPDVMAFACTSGGAFAGAEWHDLLLAEMRALTGGVPFFTAADAVAHVLRTSGIRRIALGTPYSERTIEGLLDVLGQRGIEVVSSAMLFPGGYPDPWTVMSTPPERVAEFAVRADHSRAEAVFISCTGLASTPVLSSIERRLHKPLLTSNIAVARVIRDALSLPPMAGYGSILAHCIGGLS